MNQRPRRNRKTPAIRSLVQETRLHISDLISPHFIVSGKGVMDPIKSMPGIFRLSLDKLIQEVEKLCKLGIQAIALFPVIPQESKDPFGSESINPAGILFESIGTLKREFPHLCLISDVALDPYTSHGHDGLLNEKGEVENDASVNALVEMSVLQAEAGVDMIAPSDMMDGRVGAIRRALDDRGFHQVSIHAYSAKYASAFYGPFRDALFSSDVGCKRTYQMNPANSREALLEAELDEIEGADIIMIKPALPYLDIIAKIRENTHLPISAYQVSGEYSMIKAAGMQGWVDEKKVLLESLIGIKRAGANMIFTYAAAEIAEMITSGALD